MTSTDLDLDAIQTRADSLNALGIPGATWQASPCNEKSVTPPEQAHVVEDVLRTGGAVMRSSVGVFGDERHAEFVAHARTDVPALVAEVRRLRAELATAHARLDATARLAGRQETKLRELGDPATVDAVSVSAAQPTPTAPREDDGMPRHEIWSPHCDDGCCR